MTFWRVKKSPGIVLFVNSCYTVGKDQNKWWWVEAVDAAAATNQQVKYAPIQIVNLISIRKCEWFMIEVKWCGSISGDFYILLLDVRTSIKDLIFQESVSKNSMKPECFNTSHIQLLDQKKSHLQELIQTCLPYGLPPVWMKEEKMTRPIINNSYFTYFLRNWTVIF